VTRNAREVVALSGGTGSAKFLRGLKSISRFTAVANVGDNAWFHGLYVCPDVDTVTYALAGVLDRERGWGIGGDHFTTLAALKRLGAPDTWFNIGDRDFATHIFRTEQLAKGKTLTEVTGAVARKLGVWGCKVLPATNDHVETHVVTVEKGDLHLQEFWVREGGTPTPRAVRYAGVERASPTKEVLSAFETARRILIAPANPITSIAPMLRIHGFRDAMSKSRARKVAVSPMLGTNAFSGPAAKLMKACRVEPSSTGVATLYKGLVDALVVDESDRPQAGAIERMGISCHFATTTMKTAEDEIRLARVAMEA